MIFEGSLQKNPSKPARQRSYVLRHIHMNIQAEAEHVYMETDSAQDRIKIGRRVLHGISR